MARRKQPKAQTKMEIAAELFRRYYKKKQRREIVEMFVKHADMSKNYANTAFEKLKKRA